MKKKKKTVRFSRKVSKKHPRKSSRNDKEGKLRKLKAYQRKIRMKESKKHPVVRFFGRVFK